MLTWIGAVFPIIVLFLAMTLFHMKTEHAALLGIGCAVLSALWVGQSSLSIIGMDLCKGAFSAFNILLVIWPAVFLYEMMEYAGVFHSIRKMLQRKTKDELLLILLICWLLSSFLQGITGFGVPVAVCAPILIALGVSPLWAVIITLLGHAWANTYGTFALAWDALISQSETGEIFAVKLIAGLFLWGINLAGALLISWFYGKGKAIRHMLPFVLIISTIQGGGQLLVSFGNSTIAAFLPTTLALLAGWILLSLGFYTKKWSMESVIVNRTERREQNENEKQIDEKMSLLPFGLLALISVIVLLVKPIHTIMNRAVIALSFPETRTGRGFVVEATDSYGAIHIFTHAGFVLLLAVLITLFLFLKKRYLDRDKMSGIVRASLKKLIPTSLGILFLVMMAQVLKGSGVMEMIAEGVTQLTGKYYSFAVPFLGLLGAFVTSSNTSSNILLGSFQKTAANMISVNEAAVLSAQTAGGAIGTVVGPSTILLGTTTAGCKGKEGEVLRFMIPIVLVEALFTGILSGIICFFIS